MDPISRPSRWRRPSASSTAFLLTLSVLSSIATAVPSFNISTTTFNDGYRHLFGEGNVAPYEDASGVRLLLDRYTGSSFFSLLFFKIVSERRLKSCDSTVGISHTVIILQAQDSFRPTCINTGSSARI